MPLSARACRRGDRFCLDHRPVLWGRRRRLLGWCGWCGDHSLRGSLGLRWNSRRRGRRRKLFGRGSVFIRRHRRGHGRRWQRRRLVRVGQLPLTRAEQHAGHRQRAAEQQQQPAMA
jgi:hypothetical protein